MALKYCGRCKTYKGEDLFSHNRATNDGRAHRCKGCDAKWYRGNRVTARAQYRSRKFGIQPEQFEEVLERQKGLCAVCSSKIGDGYDQESRACVDSTEYGTIRGLVCPRCSRLIGIAGSDLLRAVTAYLA